jgi:hypothetical protein
MAATAAISSARPVVFSVWFAAAARSCPAVMAETSMSAPPWKVVLFDGEPVRSPGQQEGARLLFR